MAPMSTPLPIPPKRLPAFGFNSADICREYGLPSDFYTVAEYMTGPRTEVSAKYETAGYRNAVAALDRALKARIPQSVISSLSRSVDAEWAALVSAARA